MTWLSIGGFVSLLVVGAHRGRAPVCPDADRDGVTECAGDCDDADPLVHPGITEACDGRDDDCDGRIDPAYDADGDGVTSCGGDCDDTDARVSPLAPEVLDGLDNDCDGRPDDGVACLLWLTIGARPVRAGPRGRDLSPSPPPGP